MVLDPVLHARPFPSVITSAESDCTKPELIRDLLEIERKVWLYRTTMSDVSAVEVLAAEKIVGRIAKELGYAARRKSCQFESKVEHLAHDGSPLPLK